MKKQKIIYILAAAIIGIAIGKYIYSSYKEETLQTFKSNDEDIYYLQYGVYKDENVMIENTMHKAMFLCLIIKCPPFDLIINFL